MAAPATSNESKLANGTLSPGRTRTVPRFVAQVPTMPENFPPGARAVWERVVPQLAAAQMLAVVDCDVLVMYCVTMARYYEKWGADFAASDQTQLRMMMRELGLTPNSRLSVAPLDAPDPEWKDQKLPNNVRTIAGLLSGTPAKSSPAK